MSLPILLELNQTDTMSALHSIIDNYYLESGSSMHDNGYYGLHNEKIDEVYGQGFSKLSAAGKVQAIKLLASNLI